LYKYLLVFIGFFLQFLSADDKLNSVEELFETSIVNVDLTVVQKQLEEKFYNQDKSNDVTTPGFLEDYFNIFGNKKICIGGSNSGLTCTDKSSCDTGICENPKVWYETNVAYSSKDTERLNTGFTFELGLDANFTCNGFTVGFTEKIGMLIAGIMDYIQYHFVPNILNKMFGIPTSMDPGSMMKWVVGVMIDLGCYIKVMAPTAIKTAGVGVLTYFKESTSTLEYLKEKLKKAHNAIAFNNSTQKQEAATSTNLNAGSQATSNAKEEGINALGDLQQDCREEAQKFWDELLTLKANRLVKSKQVKFYKTMCDLEKTYKKTNYWSKTATIDPSYKDKDNYDSTKVYTLGFLSVYKKDKNYSDQNPGEEDGESAKVSIDPKAVMDLLKDENKLTENEVSCPVNTNHKECQVVQNMLVDISYCIEEEINGSIFTGDMTTQSGVYKYPDICSAMSCIDATNPYCYRTHKYIGRNIYKYVPYIPFKFVTRSGEVSKSLLEQIKRKKDICIYLQALDKTQKYRLLNSYITAQYLFKEQNNLVEENIEDMIIPKMVNLDLVEKEYDSFVEDYCVRQLDTELDKAIKELHNKIETNKLMIKKLKDGDLPSMYDKFIKTELYVQNDLEGNIIKTCTYSPTMKKLRVPVIYKDNNNLTVKYLETKGTKFTIGSVDYKYSTENAMVHLPLVPYNDDSVVLGEPLFTSPEDYLTKLQQEIDTKTTIEEKIAFATSLTCRPFWNDVDKKGEDIIQQHFKSLSKPIPSYTSSEANKVKKDKQNLWFGTPEKKGIIQQKFEKDLKDIDRKLGIEREVFSIIESELDLIEIYVRD